MAARGRPDLDPTHGRGPRTSGRRHRQIPDERQSLVPHDHRHVLSEGPPGRKDALQGLPVEALHGHVQLNPGS